MHACFPDPACCRPAQAVTLTLHCPFVQVALKLLTCWESIVINSRDVVKPYIHGLLPPVVRAGILPG